jgi:hypothetical protein
LWQGALLLVGCAIALSIVSASRALTNAQTVSARTITAAAGLCWLLLPWNAGGRYWAALLPNISMLAVQGFLCASLIRGWEKNQSRVITAAVLYLWMCLSYESFYLQWITFVLLGVTLWIAKRTALRPVLVTGAGLLAAQGVAGLWNLYTKQAGYWTAIGVLPNWPRIAHDNLLNVVPAILQSVSEISIEFVFCAAVVIVIWLVVHVRSLSIASDRRAGYTTVLQAGICILGGLMSIVVHSLAGRIVTGTGVDNRSLIVFNFWLIIAGTTLITFVVDRLRGTPKAIFAFALAGFGLCLAVGQVLRASDWVTAWDLQKKVLAEAPISDLKHTEQDARIILVNQLDVNGAPIFVASWDINNAMAWAYPFLEGRRFIVYSHWVGQMKWNGSQLSYAGEPPMDTPAALYVWRPSDMSFWRSAGPFVVNPNLTIEPAK